MSPGASYLVCALATWLAFVGDAVEQLTPDSFVWAIRQDVRLFGARRVVLWLLMCLFCWWMVWLVWLQERLEAS